MNRSFEAMDGGSRAILQSPEELPPFLIIGSGRSGSTLLRRILCAHSLIHVPPETYILGPVLRDWDSFGASWEARVTRFLEIHRGHPEFETFDWDPSALERTLLELPEGRRNVRTAVDLFYRAHAAASGKAVCLWGDKTPVNTFHLPRIDEVFKDARYIHVLRDGVDAIASYVARGLYATVVEAATRWRRSVELALAFGASRPDRSLEVRYEELVANPAAEIERVAAFLGVETETRMLESHACWGALGDVPRRAHHESVREAITRERVGEGRRTLSSADRAAIARVTGDLLETLGYADALSDLRASGLTGPV